jgi:UDP-2-acetamido-2,6-beta-L-arabino-hexul-4-ose reductase
VIRILVTGGRGFLGRNLTAHLREVADCELAIADRDDSTATLNEALLNADVIFHLAGVNRPRNPVDFVTGNTEVTEQMCRFLHKNARAPKIVFSSSIQAEMDNPYGTSKAKAETALLQFAAETGASVRIYRLKNLFGKWCRPNYNSVTATFCHNIARDLPIAVSDPASELELSYVDDVVAAFLAEIGKQETGTDAGAEIPSYRIQLGDLAGRIQAFHEMRNTLSLPDFTEGSNRALYATYLSYVPSESREYGLNVRSDARGSLAEFVKQKGMGQIFVSRTKPGVTRGNHYHHTKTEKFFVVEGNGLIRMRSIEGGAIDEYAVSGDRFQVVDIPPGFTHSITNVGTEEMVTLFWSSEIFDPDRPDTYYLPIEIKTERETVVLESV